MHNDTNNGSKAENDVAAELKAAGAWEARDAFAKALNEAMNAWRKANPGTPDSHFTHEAARLFGRAGGIPGSGW